MLHVNIEHADDDLRYLEDLDLDEGSDNNITPPLNDDDIENIEKPSKYDFFSNTSNLDENNIQNKNSHTK